LAYLVGIWAFPPVKYHSGADTWDCAWFHQRISYRTGESFIHRHPSHDEYLSSLAFAITNGITIFAVSPELGPIFYGRVLGIPLPFYYVIILLCHCYALSQKYHPGAIDICYWRNRSASRLSGISVNRITLMAFVLAGLTAAIAGVLETAWLNSGAPSYGQDLGLGGIAAAVIGGASLAGGVGSMPASLVGALTVAVVQNALNLHAVPAAYQDITLGIVIVLAVGLDMWRNNTSQIIGQLFRRPPAYSAAPTVASSPGQYDKSK
jgi:ribose transport system permease protein